MKGGTMIKYQRTIKSNISFEGIGLHSGRKVSVRIKPAPANNGIVFVRRDLGNAEIKAIAPNTAATNLATMLRKNGAEVKTVEHLLGAFAGLGISNATVELDADEVPIMDGSAGPFIRMIAGTGIRTQDSVQPVLKVTRPVFVRDGDKQLAVWPAETQSISFLIDFDHPLVQEQCMSYQASEENFIREVADARTFGFLKDVELLRSKGLAKGASLENAVALSDDGVLNREGLRYRDEFVRHKVLDIIGDLSLVGMPVIGHVVAHKSGHALNAMMANKLLQSAMHWVLIGDLDRTVQRRETPVYQEAAAI
jgi:UDP-3-O-[3-hydroxymyristoyl] N-acetylglucosamine deacetylase